MALQPQVWRRLDLEAVARNLGQEDPAAGAGEFGVLQFLNRAAGFILLGNDYVQLFRWEAQQFGIVHLRAYRLFRSQHGLRRSRDDDCGPTLKDGAIIWIDDPASLTSAHNKG